MCDVLQIKRSTYCYQAVEPECEDELVQLIRKTFFQNVSPYGSRKIKVELQKKSHQVSKR